MATVRAEFDGRVFVPSGPIDLPAGTPVEVIVPPSSRRPTADEVRQWQEVLADLAVSQPVFPTVEEALREGRKRA